jgi:hypothetical protein
MDGSDEEGKMNSEPATQLNPKNRHLPHAALLVLPFFLGCVSTKLDMRNIENPIMLNALPASGDTWVAEPIEPIYVETIRDNDWVEFGNTSKTIKTRENAAEVVAYKAVGGYADRAISGFNVKAGGFGANFLVIITERAFVEGRGEVVAIGPPRPSGAATTGDESTDESPKASSQNPTTATPSLNDAAGEER